MEKKQKLGIGANRECVETLFRDRPVLENEKSENEKDLHGAREKTWDEPRRNGKASKPKSRGLQILSRVASLGRRYLGPRAPKPEVGPSTLPKAGIGWKGTWEDQNLRYKQRRREQ